MNCLVMYSQVTCMQGFVATQLTYFVLNALVMYCTFVLLHLSTGFSHKFAQVTTEQCAGMLFNNVQVQVFLIRKNPITFFAYVLYYLWSMVVIYMTV